jgi:carboxylesterase
MNVKRGCLLIHGFGGGVKEVFPLAERLREEGYKVICPILKGHTGRRKDLKGITYQDWITSAEAGLQDLLGECDEVYLIGFSMGGLIAINLALNYKVCGVVTLNAPIFYWDIKRIVLNIIEDIRKGKPENIKHYIRSGGSFPLSALLNFRKLLNKTKPKIKEVQCPVLLLKPFKMIR